MNYPDRCRYDETVECSQAGTEMAEILICDVCTDVKVSKRTKKKPFEQQEDIYTIMKKRDDSFSKRLMTIERKLGISESEKPEIQAKPEKPEPAEPPKDISKLPVWEQEKLKQSQTPQTEVKPQRKKLSSRRMLIIMAVFVALLLIAMFLRSQGWSCIIPGV